MSAPSKKKAVSLRHLAEVAGVSRMTVSRAFKEDASIKPELRKKILKVAKELGYAPDTMVSELMTSFASRRPINYQETFAAIWWPERWQHIDSGHGFEADIYHGLNEGAQLHGRRIDHFVLTKDMPPRVISRMLEARNIQGVILTPPAAAEIEAPKLDWKKLSAVTIGSSLREPKFHRAQASHYNAMIQALEILQSRGYKNPCLLVRSDVERRMLRAYTAAFLAWEYPHKHIWHAATPSSEGLSNWLKKIEPDVIIADWDPWIDYISTDDKAYGFVSLAVRDKNGPITGIYQNTARIAKGAIDLLVRARLTHEVGEPLEPLLMLTAGAWIEGSSLNQIAHKAIAKH
ncbi:LacI family DNA-binding transcriptional regulator [Coraliomargarita algicola]|uniref:LacI family DNA-binding transcriptional regulator n=1 Tax=Coraliomargarita algicola TaxID=3092156 RepID=A0ABZ0RJ48_9BACT|nr:LacI family DNA-binding transcriptional regulator [Coraliomargarita sp. J2-16]WPJ95098.1 LacI family DNA-binding transcriptional regulator [Coraliomargarita sp. J2-16]